MEFKNIYRSSLLLIITLLALTYVAFNVNKFENIYEWFQGLEKAPPPLNLTVVSGGKTVLDSYYPSGSWAGYIFIDQDFREYLDSQDLLFYVNGKLWENIKVYQFKDFILFYGSDYLILAFIHNNYGENLKNLVLTSSLVHALPYELNSVREEEVFSSPVDYFITIGDQSREGIVSLEKELEKDSFYKITFSYKTYLSNDVQIDQPTPTIVLRGKTQGEGNPLFFTWTLDATDGDERPIAIYYLTDQSWENVELFLKAMGEDGNVLYSDIKISKVDGDVDLPHTFVVYPEHEDIYKQLLSTLIAND